MACERAPHDDAVAPMMLDEGDLLRPRHAADVARRTRVRLLGGLGAVVHDEREIKAGVSHRRGTLGRCAPLRVVRIG
jgi:hypothetical protein